MGHPLLSILVCTDDGREKILYELIDGLRRQMELHRLQDSVEILIERGPAEGRPLGRKRNRLLERCAGAWCMFIDDAARYSDDVLPLVAERLEAADPDCASLTGLLDADGPQAIRLVHSLHITRCFKLGGVYYRPPGPLNPIRTRIARRFKFSEKGADGDAEWAMDLCRSGALKTQARIGKPYYFGRLPAPR